MAINFSDRIKGYNAGIGLLNEESKKAINQNKRTEYIPYSQIRPNPKNKMSMKNIEELASQIKVSGLEQPLVVYQDEDGKYTILTGHRRHAAIGLLISRGEWDESNRPVECKVKDLDEMEIPISKDMKEMLSILTTNQTREKTDSDLAFEAKNWKEVITALRNNGINYMVAGYDETGNAITRDITGMRTQEIVAEQLGISKSQVAKFNKVENNGSESLKMALRSDQININNANTLASYTKEEQEKIIEDSLEKKGDGEQITNEDILLALKTNEKKNNSSRKVDEELPEGMINSKVFSKDIKKIQKVIKTSESGIQLTESQYKDYCRYLNGLNKLFNC